MTELYTPRKTRKKPKPRHGPKRYPPGYVGLTMHSLRELHATSQRMKEGTLVSIDTRVRRDGFDTLTHAQQIKAIKRMRADGHGDYGIAAASGWSVEAVREAIGPQS